MATFAQLITFGPLFSGGLLCTLKCYHYIVGTTTLKDVYIDREKGSTAAQPVVSDANGIVSFYADGLYKFRIDGATDGATYSTLYTYDKWAVGDQSGSLSGEGAAISSAATLTLGTDGDFFHVTGNTGPITAISGTQTRVTLVFDSTPQLTHSGNLILQYAVNFVAAANSNMILVNDGAGVWREVSREPVFANLTTSGDLLTATGVNAPARLPVGASGTALLAFAGDPSATSLRYSAIAGKAIYGLTYANNAGDVTNDLDIFAGGCMDDTNAYFLAISGLTKRSDANWVVGHNQGGLDTGAVGNNDYYIWAIARSDSGVTDYLFSLSSTAPTMPTNYNYKRLIGWFKRAGGLIVLFHTYEIEGGGLDFAWDAPTLDIDLAATLTTARRTDAVKVPLNVSVRAYLNVAVDDASAATVYWIYCPDQTDQAPSATAAPLGTGRVHVAGAVDVRGPIIVRTSATGLIAARTTVATADQYRVSTLGFSWGRRN